MIAVLCRTPVHVFRTINLKTTMWKSDEVDVYVFDSFGGAEGVSERLQKTGLFGRVLFVRDSTYVYGHLGNVRALLANSPFKDELSKRRYDELFSFNVFGTANELAFNTLKKRNKDLRFNVIEDGPGVFHVTRADSKGVKYVFPFLGLESSQDHIDFWWFSKPELMEPFGSGEKRQLPPVDKNDRDFLNTVNAVFGFHGNNAVEHADILFMEECWYNDGLMKGNYDLELFKQIRDAFPKARCIVKMHPRSRENRFANDFQVVPADGIPWEVYALNYPMSSKILVSLMCTTMISSALMLHDETCSLLLYPIVKDKVIDLQTGESYVTEERDAKFEQQRSIYSDPSKYVIAYDMQQAVDTVGKWLQQKNDGGGTAPEA